MNYKLLGRSGLKVSELCLGTMGFGLPAALGAQLARPDKQVVAVVGDGGFQMTNQEIITAVQYGIPLKVIIMNNGYLGMVRQWQEMFYDRAYSEVDLRYRPISLSLPRRMERWDYVPKNRANWQAF